MTKELTAKGSHGVVAFSADVLDNGEFSIPNYFRLHLQLESKLGRNVKFFDGEKLLEMRESEDEKHTILF